MPEDFYLSQLNGVSWTWRRQCRHKSLLLRKTHGDGIAGSIASDGYRVGKACGQSGRSRAVGTCPARYGYCLSAGDVHHGIHGCRHRSGRTDGGAFGGVDALYGSRNGYRPGRKPYHRRRQRTALQPVRVRLSGRAYRLVRQTAPFSFSGEDTLYAPGCARVVLEYKGFRILPMVCYDLRFPVWSRARSDYDVAVYAASWPQARIGAWDALLRARAIENQCYVLGINRVGSDPSAFMTAIPSQWISSAMSWAGWRRAKRALFVPNLTVSGSMPTENVSGHGRMPTVLR